ncbi:MAG: hypothetical protein FWC70_00430 [Defluviitaleaceae bacterium]|nr:hypothetical protein [Defluviitaleaceae bacterium]
MKKKLFILAIVVCVASLLSPFAAVFGTDCDCVTECLCGTDCNCPPDAACGCDDTCACEVVSCYACEPMIVRFSEQQLKAVASFFYAESGLSSASNGYEKIFIGCTSNIVEAHVKMNN